MSGGEVAYHLRVNKFIDRRLFIESLERFNRFTPIEKHVYVSMAGPYLEDCRVIHHATRISRMYSFDIDEKVIRRQKINKPFGFVVHENNFTSEDAIDQLDAIRSSFGEQNSNVVIWLDYTSPKKRQSQLKDLESLIPKLIHGDIVRVTMNAHKNSLGEFEHYNRQPVDSRPPTVDAWRLAKLQTQLGKYMPVINDENILEEEGGLSQLLVAAMRNTVIDALKSRPDLVAVPMLCTSYSDQTEMVTASFSVIQEQYNNSFEASCQWSQWEHFAGEDWNENLVSIHVPCLSIRERQSLHGLITKDNLFEGQLPDFIDEEKFAQYCNHYRRYPTFANMDAI